MQSKNGFTAGSGTSGMDKSSDVNLVDNTQDMNANISYLEKQFNDDNDVIDDLLVQETLAERVA